MSKWDAEFDAAPEIPMTTEEIQRTVGFYDQHLADLGFRAEQAASDGGTSIGERLNHVRWMCSQVPRFVTEGRIDKANRWLGYIQGQLQANGVFTLETLDSLDLLWSLKVDG